MGRDEGAASRAGWGVDVDMSAARNESDGAVVMMLGECLRRSVLDVLPDTPGHA